MNFIQSLGLCGLLLLLTACVTTSDSSLSKKTDLDKAGDQYVQLGLEYIKRDDLQRARKHLQRALEIDPKNAAALGAMGLIYQEEGELKLAEKSFVASIDSDPKYTRGRTYYAAFLFSQGKFDEALKHFERAGEDTAYEGRAQIFTNIALCNLKLGKQEDALAGYEKTLRLDRTNGRALSGVTELLIQLGRYDKAQQNYNTLVAMIRQQGMSHTAQSLWQGIRIARHFGSNEQVKALATVLGSSYPDSSEYAQYRALISGGAAQ
jgi:type IV pilus assembly protein PilF